MSNSTKDIYSEPEEIDVNTLANFGPLRPLAGIWEGSKSLDVNPKAEGPVKQSYVERIELQPIDPQANGPQLFYGLRYHTHVREARRNRDISRPGGLLALVSGNADDHPFPCDPASPSCAGGRTCGGGCHDVRGQRDARQNRLRYLFNAIPRTRLPHRFFPHGGCYQ